MTIIDSPSPDLLAIARGDEAVVSVTTASRLVPGDEMAGLGLEIWEATVKIETDDESHVVAQATGLRVERSLPDNAEAFFWALDCESAELGEFAALIRDNAEDILGAVTDGDAVGALYLESIIVAESLRGFGLGAIAAAHLFKVATSPYVPWLIYAIAGVESEVKTKPVQQAAVTGILTTLGFKELMPGERLWATSSIMTSFGAENLLAEYPDFS